MLTTMKVDYHFMKDQPAVILEKVNILNVNARNVNVKLYIPALMPDIPKGIPGESVVTTKGTTMFSNDISCRPVLTSMVIREKNFLTATMNSNSGTQYIDVRKYNADKKLIVQYIPAEKQVRCKFLNGKITKLYFNTDTA